ncbi:hypothetical protein B7494_g4603 [Chlorociboria aeruginascens]|nr:hypothetical protein B7494_g4603 [Chlorociboria aeruginascens]
MSRHKLIKNLDLDDELDDFDGGEDYDYEGEDTAEAEGKLGTIMVREALPPDASKITEKQIHDALWHYFYDVQKSVSYLVNNHLPKAQKMPKTEGKYGAGGSISFTFREFCGGPGSVEGNGLGELSQATSRPNHVSVNGFFKDTPWLNVPSSRRAIFTAPLYPRGGLLGGSSNKPPKMSKLQALAAARKKKAQEQKAEASIEVDRPMASLSLGGLYDNEGATGIDTDLGAPIRERTARRLPLRKRKDSNPHQKTPKPPSSSSGPVQICPDIEMDDPLADQAEPSAFANTMFGNTRTSRQSTGDLFTLPYSSSTTVSSTNPFAGPSPDDVVIAAQSKAAGKGGKGPPKISAEKKADQIANGVEAMKIDDTPRARSRNLDVLAEFEKTKSKNAANFVVIGKSTLMGRLLLDLKEVDQRTMDKYRHEAEKIGKSSFALAWVLDQGTEERNRGVTIDIATRKFETEKTVFTILDAPGHRDFIPNMIAGASQADFAVLVIDASTGEFESGLLGQTKEHALLVRSMGVQRIIIAVNKLDTVNWSQERFNEISQQVSSFLAAAGFQPKNISFVPCSGLHGDNIARKSSETSVSWYTGPTLVEELDNSEPVARALNKPLRITIGDIFRGGVQNPLSISGRIDSGSLQIGDALIAQPSNEKCFIKGLEIDDGPVNWAVAGQNITVHLSDIDPTHLKIGDVLCPPTNPIKNIKEFTLKVLAFEFLMPMQVDVHRGRLHAAGKIRELKAVLDKGSGAVTKKRPKIVKGGQVARVIVELETAVPLEAPGKVVLRSNGVTIAAGLLE